jgi:thiosulfate/3-mercaptopyruvate sulfurtransferase
MAESHDPHGDLLVSVAWLAPHLHDPQVTIVDARSAQDSAAGHVLGAVLLPNGALRSTCGVPDACTPEAFGATTGTGGARTWWVCARFGSWDVRFLNGGFRQWTAGGHPTSTEAVQPHPATYQLGEAQDHLACSRAQAEAHVRDNDVLFWDMCSAGEYSGANARSNPPARAGHILRAVHLEWTELVDPMTGLCTPADEMRRLLDAKGLTPDKAIVSSCQGGGRAAHGVLALQRLGSGRARNFDGSYGAYAASTAPVERSRSHERSVRPVIGLSINR